MATDPDKQFTLAVIIPCYNEVDNIETVLQRVQATGLADEIIIVDDGSSDGTREVLARIADEGHAGLQVLLMERNQGKGAALRRGFAAASADLLLVQDADLEYDPRDYPLLLQPLQEGIAPVVYGSRFLGGPRKAMYFWNMVANKSLTLLTNVLYNAILSDMMTCYKLFRRELLADMTLRADGFDFEPEVTAKVLKRGIHIYEVPISYNGREWAEGKKIRASDSLPVLWTLLKYRFMD